MKREAGDETKQQAGEVLKNLIANGIVGLQTGNMERAERLFREALSLQTRHPDACHLLAVTLIQRNRNLNEAEELIGIALEEKPDEPVFHNSLGTLLWHKGDILQASTHFEKAVSARPDYVDALYNSGNAYRELGDHDKALRTYKRTLEVDPSYVNAYNDLGLVYESMGKSDEAIQQFILALELDPARADVYLNLANAYQSLGEFDDACLAIQNSLTIMPDDSRAYNNLGTVYYAQENYDEAEEVLRQALDLDPDSVHALYNLGLTLHHQAKYEEAIAAFEKALLHFRSWPSAWVNKANALYKLGRFEEAIMAYEEAIALLPSYVAAYLNLASTYRRMCQLEKAIEYYDQAIALRPDSGEAHFGKSLVLLKSGQMSAGWRHYEWRFEVTGKHFNPHPDLCHPEWRGQSINGKTLMVLGEQGLGDIIHFVRYLRFLKGECKKIVLACTPSLMPLLESMGVIDEFVDRGRPVRISCDYHIHLLSLPRIFNTTVSNIPGDTPYLFADERKVANWRRRLNKEEFNIGLVWFGNPEQAENEYRSCPLTELEPLREVAGVRYYSLQKGAGAEQLKAQEVDMRIVDFTEDLEDFSDTAALIKALDLVITIDTSVAHLAGALNAPVWTILWYAHCWRYLRYRDDSPWYPSMRVFRQPTIGDWRSVVVEVKQELQKHVSKSRTAVPKLVDRSRTRHDEC